MHVCFINLPIEFYSPTSGGAIATIIAQTGKALIQAGHRVTVLTPVDGNTTYDTGEVISLAVKRRDDLSFVRRRVSDLRRRVGRWDWPYFEYYLTSVTRRLAEIDGPDVVVLFNDLYTSPQVRRVVPRASVVVWLQNEWRTDPTNLPATVAATDVFLTCSRYIADWTARTHGIPAGRFAVVPSGVDLTAFHPRANHLEPPAPPKVLFIGRIDPNKGPDLAADAVVALQQEGVDVRLTVAGGLWFYGDRDPMTDPFFRQLHRRMRAAGATYLGHVPRADVPALVRSHDIVCVLSRSNEPFGLVTLEAMASGCAVIASDRGGLPEACGGGAELVNPDDLNRITAILRAWATDPEALARAKLRCGNRASVASWAVTAEQFIRAVTAARAAVPLGRASKDGAGAA